MKKCDTTITSSPFECIPLVPSYDSVRIIPNDVLCINREWGQVRFPKSKKARIRKKWAKNDRNFGSVEKHLTVQLKGENIIFVSQKMYDTLMKKYKSELEPTTNPQ